VHIRQNNGEIMVKLRSLGTAALLLGLSSCSTANILLFHPAGPVAGAEWRFTIIDVAVMCLLIVPVAIITAVFIWRYRKSAGATYDPKFSHSLPLEVVMWGVPLALVCLLGFFSYQSTFLVNPGEPTSLSDDSNVLNVDVITTDWQWVFVYPDQKIATVDTLVVPAGRRVQLRLTSTSVTNDFYIPQVAPMIDVMPGMRTGDAFQVNRPGNFEGFSADFSGAGFSWMQFATHVVSPADFKDWVAKTEAAPKTLSYTAFTKLAQPTFNMKATPIYFGSADPHLLDQVVTAAMNGTVYPVPDDIMTKAPNPTPTPAATSTPTPVKPDESATKQAS
jgi:cytochrome o ubiquinol oxidase subunit 2